MTRLRIPHMTSSNILGVVLLVMAITAYGLHLAFPNRPIGEQLIGMFLMGGLTALKIPQKLPPTINPPAQPGTGEHP